MIDPAWMDEIDQSEHGIRYYDRQGNPMTPRQYQDFVVEHGFERKRVAEDHVGDCWVSTVWLGMDHGFNREHPLIFETMVFNADGEGRDYWRYSTEQEALDGHRATVAMLEASQTFTNNKEHP